MKRASRASMPHSYFSRVRAMLKILVAQTEHLSMDAKLRPKHRCLLHMVMNSAVGCSSFTLNYNRLYVVIKKGLFMARTVVLHIMGEDPVLADLEQEPQPSDAFIKVSNSTQTRRKGR